MDDHDWDATMANRISGTGCPYCTSRKAGKENNLSVLFPDIAKQWHPTKYYPLTPEDVTPGSHTKAW